MTPLKEAGRVEAMAVFIGPECTLPCKRPLGMILPMVHKISNIVHLTRAQTEGESVWQISGSSLRASLVHAYEGLVQKEALLLQHPAPPCTAWLVLKGSVEVTVDEKKYLIPTGSWGLLPARPRFHRMKPGTRLLSVRFHLHREGTLEGGFRAVVLKAVHCDELKSAAHKLLRWVHTHEISKLERRQLVVKSVPVSERALQEAEFLAAFAAWVNAFLCALNSSGQRMTAPEADPRLLHVLEKLTLETTPSVQELAERCNLGLSQFKRLFHHAFRQAPSAWLNQRRLSSAQRLLQSYKDPVKTVAATLGFSSAAHFVAWFRRHTGTTPAKFRDGMDV